MNRNTTIYAGIFSALIVLFCGKSQAQEVKPASETVASIAYTTLDNADAEPAFKVFPASVKKNARIVINAEKDGWAVFQVKSACGKTLLEQQMAVTKGYNRVPVFFVSNLAKGDYTTVLRVEENVYFSKLVKE